MNHPSLIFKIPAAAAHVLLFVLLCAQPPSCRAQIHLRDAMERAVTVNHGLRAAELNSEAAAHGVSAAWGRLLPEVGVSILYTHMDKDLVLDLDPIRSAMIRLQAGNLVSLSNLESVVTQGRPLTAQEQAAVALKANSALEQQLPHFQETLKERTFLQGAVTAKQPIFTGGKIAAGIRVARAQEGMADAREDAQRGDIATEAVSRTLDALLSRENVLVRRSALATVRRHHERAAAMQQQGLIARHDLQRAAVALADAERELFEAEQKSLIACTALGSVLDLDPDSVTVLDTLRYAPLPLTLNDVLISVRSGNSSLKQLRAAGQALDGKTDAHRGEYLPNVFGFAMLNLFDHYMIEKAEPKWAVGIGFNLTLFDGLRRTQLHQQSRLEAEAMRETTAETERKLELLARSTWMSVQLAEKQYLALNAASDQAEENLHLNSRRYDEGLGTSLELIDAQLSLSGILLKRTAALRDYYSAIMTLQQISGTPEEFLPFWESTQLH